MQSGWEKVRFRAQELWRSGKRAAARAALDRLMTLEQIELYKEARAKDAIKKLEEERAKEIENLRKQEEQVAKKSQYV